MKRGATGFGFIGRCGALGVENRVVDSASIEVNRRARRTKTDRIDALKLVMMLVRVCCGEQRVWREVRVPSAEAEAARHRSRERTALAQEQTRLRNQIGSWLATCGCRVTARTRQQPPGGRRVRDWADAPLPAPVHARIARAEARLALVADADRDDRREQTATVRPRGRRARSRASCSSKASRRRARRCCSMKAWCGARFRIGGRLVACWDSRRRNTTAASRNAIRASAAPAISGCNR